MARRLKVLTDEHLSSDLVEGLRRRGFTVLRVEDEPRLRKRCPDENILEFALERGYAWLTRDGRVQRALALRLARGRQVPGVVCWLQKHKRITIGQVISSLETLDAETDPFARGIRYIKPSGID